MGYSLKIECDKKVKDQREIIEKIQQDVRIKHALAVNTRYEMNIAIRILRNKYENQWSQYKEKINIVYKEYKKTRIKMNEEIMKLNKIKKQLNKDREKAFLMVSERKKK